MIFGFILAMIKAIAEFLKRYRLILLAAIIGLTALGRSLHFIYEEDFKGAVIYSDAEGYYLYLPSVFIYGDFQEYEPRTPGSLLLNEKGEVWSKYTCGVALLQMPFFLIADGVALITDFERNGQSDPYIIGVSLSATFYLALGIFLIAQFLSKRINFKITALTLLIIFLGTNLLFYSAQQPGMSHVYSFFLCCLLLKLLEKWGSEPPIKLITITGLVFGLIILVRPTNGILLLLVLVLGVQGVEDFKNRLLLFLKRPLVLLVFVASITLVFIPQFIYWWHSTGSIITYSYSNEGFTYWNDPRMWKVLFDVQNGWLIYSPVMLFSLAGIPRLIRLKPPEGWGTLLIILLATYIFGSWWAWWFGGAYGHRCYVEYYALLSLPFAYFLNGVKRVNRWVLVLLILVIVAMIIYNLQLAGIYYYTAPWDGDNWTWERFVKVLERAFS